MRFSVFIVLCAVALLALVFPVSVAAQQKKLPEAIVAPVAAIGAVREAERVIIFNSLREQLSAHFQIVSQENYKAAEERAFQDLDLEQCTVDQCIRKIQEILQVERFFVLQLVRDAQFTQLSLTLVTLEGKTFRTGTCRGCDIGQLNEKVAGLVAKVLNEVVVPEMAARVAPATPPPPEQTAKPAERLDAPPQTTEPTKGAARQVKLSVWGTVPMYEVIFSKGRLSLMFTVGSDNSGVVLGAGSRFLFSKGDSWFLGGIMDAVPTFAPFGGYEWIWHNGVFFSLTLPTFFAVGWAF